MGSLYCCYSIELRNFLNSNGLRYEICALNHLNRKRHMEILYGFI